MHQLPQHDGERAGAELWDVVKYDHLDGIVKVPDVQGEFVFDQTPSWPPRTCSPTTGSIPATTA